MHEFQHLSEVFEQAPDAPALHYLAPGTAMTRAVEAYFHHYRLDALFSSTPSVYAGFIDTGRFNLWCQVWSPIAPKGTVFVVHGYFDHLGLYRHLLKSLLEKGWLVVLWDLPGHGLSSGPRAEIGEFDDYQHCFSHVKRTLDAADLAPAPWLGIGQSTGAAILATDALEQREAARWAGIVLLAPLVRPWRWGQASWVHLIASPFVKELPRKYRPNSTDETFTAFLRDQDPLQPERLSVVWISAMRRWIPKLLAFEPLALPTLILQGEQDTTVDWERNLEILTAKFPAATVYRHPQARHHLVNESPAIRQALFAQLEAFVDAVDTDLPAPPASRATSGEPAANALVSK
ncbi:alpha/beta hydrolase [Vreelandella malpeensis]|uniref:Alpha/beta hydrolase n=1 Tax=Vreelandella malpeensis TaxID=1172368 RepID=A0ABS8DSV3_9GAMM|nr:alpha/beta hydrolase [Halomonas malpeensis]MCB8889330.1 alpha/beta hydrolase [Halomonas malpeensis]